jgi:hypothetical protein
LSLSRLFIFIVINTNTNTAPQTKQLLDISASNFTDPFLALVPACLLWK